MKIGIFSECYKPTKNGVVSSIDTFREQFLKLGHEVFVFAPKTPGYKEVDENVFRFDSVRFPGQAYYPIGVPISPKIKKIVKNANLDIIHVQSLFPISRFGRKMARKFKIPVIMTYHTLIEEYAHYVPGLKSLAKKAIISLSRSFANSMDHVVTPSKPMRDVLESYGITTPISVIPTGVKVELFPDVNVSQVRKKYMISPSKHVILYCGRIAKEKNLELLLKALYKMLKKTPNVHLIIAGDGPEKQFYKSLAQKLNLTDNITWLGFLEKKDINWLYAGAEVFAFPSVTDTQGIVVIESFAGHTPVVACDKLGPSALVSDGVDGYLTKNNADEFSQKLLDIIKNDKLRENMAQKAYEKAQKFSAQKMAERMLDLYKVVILHQKRN